MDAYSADRGYGFLRTLTDSGGDVCSSERPFVFATDLPPGSYDVTVELGHPMRATTTTVKAEARRLMLEAVPTAPGRFVTRTFTVHVRTPLIPGGDSVRLNAREVGSFTWDQRLTLEFNGDLPSVRAIYIEPARNPITLHLAGNSTVTDQTTEPYASWGQMFTRFFQPRAVVVANHAESGETLRAFAAEKRLQQALSLMREGDYLFIEFAHNDQKPGPNHLDAFTTYKATLRDYIRQARARGATPVLVTPVHRRNFDAAGQIVNTLGDYPEAVRQTAREEKVTLIDLNAMSETFYEALGIEGSKKSLVHYPAGTFPGQERALEDNTHHNAYGAYELAKMVVEGLRASGLPIARYIVGDVPPFDPARPDPVEGWRVPASPAAATSPTPAGS
ncbi:MAG: rhamnogalacturonan acetylesterase [Gemmatimonadetes bacterium]|nr:rhamnogalacturonan acetylesterase [Gemmatimonadota bacterium]